MDYDKVSELTYNVIVGGGTDYDIAMLFLQMFPDCQRYSEKEISMILSNQIATCFVTKANQYSLFIYQTIASYQTTNNEVYEEYLLLQRKSLEIVTKLKTNLYKKGYIAEIRALR